MSNKKVKKYLKAFIMLSIFLAVTLLNIFTINIRAYAYGDEKPCLKNIYLSEYDKIEFEQDKYEYVVDVDKNIDEIILKAKPEDSTYTVEINKKKLKEDEKYKYTSKLDLGKNVFNIKVYNPSNDKYSVYKVFIYRGGKEEAYLKDLILDDSNFGFSSDNRFYNIELDEGTTEAIFKAETQDDNFTVSVQDTVLNSSNTIKFKFKEKAGKYSFKIKVKDNQTNSTGEYVINIYLGIPVTPNVNDALNKVLKPNQWVIVNGRWQYNDILGKPIKDNWFYDSKYDGYYHFNSRGNMQTGWVIIDNNTYYLGNDGKMRTGWIDYQDKWYYLDSNGKMVVDWAFIDYKWYYFNSFGSMQTGWLKLDNKWYFLSSSGCMRTGWILYDKKWYYLDSNGMMKTGWIYDEGNWYYLNHSGYMESGKWIYYNYNWYYINYSGTMRCGWLYKNNNYYYMDEYGRMVIGKKLIDGYEYNFNEDGVAILS